jgi:hypothetical protein
VAAIAVVLDFLSICTDLVELEATVVFAAFGANSGLEDALATCSLIGVATVLLTDTLETATG